MHTASRGPSDAPRSAKTGPGQATTTSSAMGKRRLVAKISLASHTTTRYPSTLATLASAAVKSTAPKMSICGGGAQLSTKMLMLSMAGSSGLFWPSGP